MGESAGGKLVTELVGLGDVSTWGEFKSQRPRHNRPRQSLLFPEQLDVVVVTDKLKSFFYQSCACMCFMDSHESCYVEPQIKWI